MRRITTGTLAATACWALCPALAMAADHFSQVPVVVSQDLVRLRAMLDQSSSRVIRIGVIGDSQEACPDSWGRHYLMEANGLLAEAFGPASETVLLQQKWWDTDPNWLAITQSWESQPPVPMQIAPSAVPPGVVGTAMVGPDDGTRGFIGMLLPNAERCPVAERVGTPAFLDGPNIVLDLLVSRRTDMGDLAWHAAIAPTTHPNIGNQSIADGALFTSSIPANTPFAWVSTPALPVPTVGWRQVRVSGVDAARPVDVLGARFRNASTSRGVVLQPLAVGGMGLPGMLQSYGNCAAALNALELDAVVLHFGANDSYITAAQWKARLVATIAVIRSARQDATFPIIVAADSFRLALPPGSGYEFFPGASAEVAQADPAVTALNMRRVHDERFLWNDAQHYGLADNVHHLPHAQRMIAMAFVGTLLEAVGLTTPGCDPGEPWYEHHHPIGGSCSVSWPCTHVVRADALAVGRPFAVGANCDDADGDGSPDICIDPSSPDVNNDGQVDGSDLGVLLNAWGTSDTNADITNDGTVNGEDLGLVFVYWGPVP